MSKNKKIAFLFLFIICLFVPALVSSSESAVTPTLIEAEYDSGFSAVVVTGLCADNSDVLIYVDGEYSGLADINETKSTTKNFVFYIIKDLPVGTHQITVLARDKTSSLLSAPSASLEYVVEPLPAPTLLAPSREDISSNVRPLILGLSESDTIVHLVIDDVVNGNTGLISHESGTANFAYEPFLNLGVGLHQVYAITESKDGRKSKASRVLEFEIEEAMIAPTVFEPLNSGKTVIKGLAPNDSLIKVYVDHELDGQFVVKNHESGTANFAYTPFQDLTTANHLVYLTASDERGKESPWSNLVYLQARIPKIADGVEEIAVLSNEAVFGTEFEDLLLLAALFQEDKTVSVSDDQFMALENLIIQKNNLGLGLDALENLEALWEAKRLRLDQSEEQPLEPSKEEADQTKSTDKTFDQTLATSTDVDEFIGEFETEDTQSGLIDEDKQKQSNLRWNIAIFILFLLAVIIWIFWVNRELVKEQEEQDKKDE